MNWVRMLIWLVLPLLVYGDEASNVTDNATTSATTVTQAATSLVSTTTTTAIPSTAKPSTEQPTKPPPLPSKRTTFLNTTGYACSCDSTVRHCTKFKYNFYQTCFCRLRAT